MDGAKVTRLHPISRPRKDLEPGSVSGTLGSLARARGYCGRHSAGGWHSEHMPLIEALCCPSGISAHLGGCMPTANQNITIMLLDLFPAVPSKFRQIQYIIIIWSIIWSCLKRCTLVLYITLIKPIPSSGYKAHFRIQHHHMDDPRVRHPNSWYCKCIFIQE